MMTYARTVIMMARIMIAMIVVIAMIVIVLITIAMIRTTTERLMMINVDLMAKIVIADLNPNS